ncbi:hypothetical protein ACGFSB_22050 [Streptomyces sp. NPDC048441]|uniref:hypothetical protein n=1 Tax=Streptomyces sp. NPDC048441 TaxID=3365552 RepID=UPI0037199C7D
MTTISASAQHLSPAAHGRPDLVAIANAIERGQALAQAQPMGEVADAIAAELTMHLKALIRPAQHRLTALGAAAARDVLRATVEHARHVYLDVTHGVHTSPAARLHLLAGACRLLLPHVESQGRSGRP